MKRKSPEIVLVFEIQPWIHTVVLMKELVDSHSRSDGTYFMVLILLIFDTLTRYWGNLGLFGENCPLRLLFVWGR